MDFVDHLKVLGEKVTRLKDQTKTEEATKAAFIMPFIHNVLGYDVFNPMEVIPEFVADIGLKKGEKVDYCILKDEKPIIIVECKWWGSNLDVHDSQLFRYFHTVNARFGLLTNGIIYRFYTDLEVANKMDEKPFLEFNISDLKENLIPEIKRFHKASFNVDEILNTASELKYAKEVRTIMQNQLSNPSVEFVRFFASQIYKGKLHGKVLEQFAPIIKKSLNNLISDLISDRLKTALDHEQKVHQPGKEQAINEAIEDVKIEKENKVDTTEFELEAFFIIKSILRSHTRSERISYKDTQNYICVTLDNSIKKQVCRLWLNGSKKYIGLFDETNKEIRYPIDSLEDLYNYSEQLANTALKYPDKVSVS